MFELIRSKLLAYIDRCNRISAEKDAKIAELSRLAGALSLEVNDLKATLAATQDEFKAETAKALAEQVARHATQLDELTSILEQASNPTAIGDELLKVVDEDSAIETPAPVADAIAETVDKPIVTPVEAVDAALSAVLGSELEGIAVESNPE
jgi:hypothetical protein